MFTVGEDEPSDENGQLSLKQGRANYLKYQACDERFILKVRKPTDKELCVVNYEK